MNAAGIGDLNLASLAFQYPRLAGAFMPLMTVSHSDPADQEAFSQAKDQLIQSLSSNPDLPGNIEEQLKTNPDLKGEILELAQNDPKALNEMMPDLIANSENLAEVIANHQQPAATEPQVVENAPEQTEHAPAPENQLPPIELGATQEPAAGAASSSVVPASNEPGPEEVVNEALAERATTMGGMTNTARSTLTSEHFNPNARGDEQVTAQTNQAEAENNADQSADQTTQERPSPQVQAADIIAELREKPGGAEFFDRAANDPTLGEALNNAMKGEGSDPAHMLATLQDVQKMAEEDDRLFVKVNKYMDDHPGAMQQFANTFANDPDKAFMDLKMGMMTDNIQNMLEGPLTSLLGPELAGKIMGWIAPIMQLFTGFNEMFPQELETISQSNNDKGPSLSSELQEVDIAVSVDQNGQARATADNAADPAATQDDEHDRQKPTTTAVPGAAPG